MNPRKRPEAYNYLAILSKLIFSDIYQIHLSEDYLESLREFHGVYIGEYIAKPNVSTWRGKSILILPHLWKKTICLELYEGKYIVNDFGDNVSFDLNRHEFKSMMT